LLSSLPDVCAATSTRLFYLRASGPSAAAAGLAEALHLKPGATPEAGANLSDATAARLLLLPQLFHLLHGPVAVSAEAYTVSQVGKKPRKKAGTLGGTIFRFGSAAFPAEEPAQPEAGGGDGGAEKADSTPAADAETATQNPDGHGDGDGDGDGDDGDADGDDSTLYFSAAAARPQSRVFLHSAAEDAVFSTLVFKGDLPPISPPLGFPVASPVAFCPSGDATAELMGRLYSAPRPFCLPPEVSSSRLTPPPLTADLATLDEAAIALLQTETATLSGCASTASPFDDLLLSVSDTDVALIEPNLSGPRVTAVHSLREGTIISAVAVPATTYVRTAAASVPARPQDTLATLLLLVQPPAAADAKHPPPPVIITFAVELDAAGAALVAAADAQALQWHQEHTQLFADRRAVLQEAFDRARSRRLAAEAAAEAAEAERLAAERAEAARLEAERLAAERAEAERLEAERAEAERIAAKTAEAERIAAAQLAEALATEATALAEAATGEAMPADLDVAVTPDHVLDTAAPTFEEEAHEASEIEVSSSSDTLVASFRANVPRPLSKRLDAEAAPLPDPARLVGKFYVAGPVTFPTIPAASSVELAADTAPLIVPSVQWPSDLAIGDDAPLTPPDPQWPRLRPMRELLRLQLTTEADCVVRGSLLDVPGAPQPSEVDLERLLSHITPEDAVQDPPLAVLALQVSLALMQLGAPSAPQLHCYPNQTAVFAAIPPDRLPCVLAAAAAACTATPQSAAYSVGIRVIALLAPACLGPFLRASPLLPLPALAASVSAAPDRLRSLLAQKDCSNKKLQQPTCDAVLALTTAGCRSGAVLPSEEVVLLARALPASQGWVSLLSPDSFTTQQLSAADREHKAAANAIASVLCASAASDLEPRSFFRLLGRPGGLLDAAGLPPSCYRAVARSQLAATARYKLSLAVLSQVDLASSA
jgi:hypothetical protein